jgi:hydroxyacylglutathione hydrolase
MEIPGSVIARGAPGIVRSLQERFWVGPPHPVARALSEGDEVGGFTVLETPGHTPGHVSYWRERDRVLIAGDVLTNMNPSTGVTGLHEPLAFATPDPARNRACARRLAELQPALVCFGHGPPLRDPEELAKFVAGLPTD